MGHDAETRTRLIVLANAIQNARDCGWEDSESLEAFEKILPGTDIYSLSRSDLSIETIVDVCLGISDARRKLVKSEMLTLVRNIMSPENARARTEAETLLEVEAFIYNCKHAAGTDLLFYPEAVFGADAKPTAEEIVDKAIGQS